MHGQQNIKKVGKLLPTYAFCINFSVSGDPLFHSSVNYLHVDRIFTSVRNNIRPLAQIQNIDCATFQDRNIHPLICDVLPQRGELSGARNF